METGGESAKSWAQIGNASSYPDSAENSSIVEDKVADDPNLNYHP